MNTNINIDGLKVPTTFQEMIKEFKEKAEKEGKLKFTAPPQKVASEAKAFFEEKLKAEKEATPATPKVPEKIATKATADADKILAKLAERKGISLDEMKSLGKHMMKPSVFRSTLNKGIKGSNQMSPEMIEKLEAAKKLVMESRDKRALDAQAEIEKLKEAFKK